MALPKLILIDGPMGSGKTTVSQLLQKRMEGLVALLSLDRFKRLVSNHKPDSKIHLSLASDVGAAMTNQYLKQKVDVIVEKAFTRDEFVKDFLKKIRVKCKRYVYQLEAPLNLRKSRVKERELHPEVTKRPPMSKVIRNSKNYKEFRYQKAIVFDSSKLTPL